MSEEFYSIKRFWPDGRTVNSVFVSRAQALGLNQVNLSKAKKGTLSRAKVSTVKALLALASEFAGRPVAFEEICSDADVQA